MFRTPAAARGPLGEPLPARPGVWTGLEPTALSRSAAAAAGHQPVPQLLTVPVTPSALLSSSGKEELQPEG